MSPASQTQTLHTHTSARIMPSKALTPTTHIRPSPSGAARSRLRRSVAAPLRKRAARRGGFIGPWRRPLRGARSAQWSLRRHPDRAVQADRFAVEHVVRDDAVYQLGVVLGRPRRAGKGMLAASESCTSGMPKIMGVPKMPGRWSCSGCRSWSQVARDGQGHAGHARLRRGIGRLADLAVEGRDGRGVDHDAAFARWVRAYWRSWPRRPGAHHVAADQVDAHHLLEQVQRVGAVLADDLGGGGRRSSPGRTACQLARGGHGALAVGFLGDVAMHVALTQFLARASPGSSCRSAITTLAPLATSMRCRRPGRMRRR